ncbi:MAG: hypothetical protein ABSG81_10975 [Acidimicrobiales bacterium]|jgi:hypothetical protein
MDLLGVDGAAASPVRLRLRGERHVNRIETVDEQTIKACFGILGANLNRHDHGEEAQR